MDIRTMSRAELEAEVVCNEALPCDLAGLDRIAAMSADELRAALQAWIVAGDECAS